VADLKASMSNCKVKEKSVDDLKKNNNSGTVLNTDLMKKEDPAYNKKANTTNVKDQSISDASGKKYTSLADLNNNSTGDNVSKSKSKYNNIFSPNDVNYMDQDQAIIDTTSTRQIDVGVMKTLQSNEKLLFESDYFFRTSKFTSLTETFLAVTRICVTFPTTSVSGISISN